MQKSHLNAASGRGGRSVFDWFPEYSLSPDREPVHEVAACCVAECTICPPGGDCRPLMVDPVRSEATCAKCGLRLSVEMRR